MKQILVLLSLISINIFAQEPPSLVCVGTHPETKDEYVLGAELKDGKLIASIGKYSEEQGPGNIQDVKKDFRIWDDMFDYGDNAVHNYLEYHATTDEPEQSYVFISFARADMPGVPATFKIDYGKVELQDGFCAQMD